MENKTKANKNPEVRFKGFTGDWDSKKLEHEVDITMGQSPNSKNYTNNKSDYILVQGNADMKFNRVLPRVWTTEITKIADKGDIIFSVRAPVGDVGKTDFNVVIGRGVAAIKGSDFIYHLLIYMNGNDYWKKISTGSTFESINSFELKEAKIALPNNKTEQKKIGSYFQNLDNLIRLHQKKYEKLTILKKAMLHKMFPQNGKLTPEIRFKGFERDWEEMELEQKVDITMGQSPDGNNYTNNKEDYILVQGNADMKNNRVVPRVYTSQVTKTANSGDLIISVRAPVGDIGKTDYDVVIGRGVAAIKGNEFIYQVLIRMKEFEYWKQFSSGSTFDSINSNHLKEAIISIPTEQEQQKIGIYFKNLDNQIALHQTQLTKLNNIKKACFTKLFVAQD